MQDAGLQQYLHQIPRSISCSLARAANIVICIHSVLSDVKHYEHNLSTQKVKLLASSLTFCVERLLLHVLQITSTIINGELQAETMTNNLPTCAYMHRYAAADDCAVSSTLSSVMHWSSQQTQRSSSDHTSV